MPGTANPQPFEIIEGDRRKGLVLLADHAKNLLPETYGSLGLTPSDFHRHIAYDIGVEGVVRRISGTLGVPAVLCGFSRLLIDPNRGEDDPTLIRQLYDRTVIPGNYPLDAAERQRRMERWYKPYHQSVGAMIRSVEKESGMAPLVVSIHSFTPQMHGILRPWHVAVLWDNDDRAVKPFFDILSREPALCVGDNEPYDGALAGDTMSVHATSEGLAHALIEIRQDLIASENGQTEWAARLAPALDEINRLPDIHKRKFFGSRSSSGA